MENPLKPGKKYKSGYVLSGGAARGFAHLGVIKALEENEIKPDVISGVSVGSIIGAFYADGFSWEEILDLFEKRKLYSFTQLSIPRSGLLDVSKLRNFLQKNLRSKEFDHLKIPLYITATNYTTGEAERFNQGNLVDAIMASSSIPVLFKPAIINNESYIDGGITDNLPVEPIKDCCKHLIGIHVNPVGIEKGNQGLLNIAIRTFHLSVAADIENKKNLFQYFFEPLGLKEYNIMDMSKGREMFEVGYQDACEILK